MKFAGQFGTEIELLDDSVKIKTGKNETGRTIRLSDIVSVNVIKPGLTSSGCIHIQVIGARTYSQYDPVTRYSSDANAVFFRKPQHQEALTMKDEIEKAIQNHAGNSRRESWNIDMDGLRQLKQLLDEGVITQDDFDRKKAKMLGI